MIMTFPSKQHQQPTCIFQHSPEYSLFFVHIARTAKQQTKPKHSKKGKTLIETERQGEVPRLWLS
jgi:hypothetical protein